MTMPRGLVGEVLPPFTGKDARSGEDTYGVDGLTGILVTVLEDTGKTPDVLCSTLDDRAWPFREGPFDSDGRLQVYVPRARIKTRSLPE